MSLLPVNDNFMVEVGQASQPGDIMKTGHVDPDDGVRSGKVVDISDFMTYFGSHTFYFDKTVMNEELLQQIHDKYKTLVGKTVYWPERSESGTVVEYEGKQYLFMKFASLMAVEET